MSRRNLFIPILLAMTLATAACADQTPVPTSAPATVAPLVVRDSRGEEFSLEGPTSRVVSLAPSNTEILFALGAGDQLVGRDEFSDYPEEAMEVESIGSTYGDLNVEAIVGLEPDLVLAAGITPPEQIQSLEEVGLPVFVLGNPGDFDGLFDNLLKTGALTGHEEEAAALVEDLRARYEAVTERTAGVEAVPLYYEVDGTDPAAPWTTGSGTFQQLIFDLAGGENIAADLEGWAQLNSEEIVVRDPEVIIFADGVFVPTTVETVKNRPGWGEITAVQEDQVYGLDTDLLDLPGPRLVEGLEAVAAILHPQLFDG